MVIPVPAWQNRERVSEDTHQTKVVLDCQTENFFHFEEDFLWLSCSVVGFLRLSQHLGCQENDF